MNVELTTIKEFSDSADANICKGKLESEGIQCHLLGEEMVNNTQLWNTYGPIKLQVKSEDAERAKEILT